MPPDFIPPMNATLVAARFDNPEWLFEVKWDGFRVETIVDDGQSEVPDAGRSGCGSVLRVLPGAADVDRGQAGNRRRRGNRRGRSGRTRLRPAPGRHQGPSRGRLLARPRSCTWSSTSCSSTGARFSPSRSRSDDVFSPRRCGPILASASASTSSAMAWPPSPRPRSADWKGSWRRTGAPRTNPGCAR